MSGRRGAVAGDEQTREVTLRHSSCEADEQSRATTGGAKSGDRRETRKGAVRSGHRIGKACHTPYTAKGRRQGKAPGNRVKAIPFSSLRHRASKTSVFRRAMAPDEARFTVGIAAFPSPQPHSREARDRDLTRGASLSTPQTQAEFFPCQVEFIPLLFGCYSAVIPLLRSDEFPCSTGIHAGSSGRERGFSAVSLPRGFCSSRGARRSASVKIR
jgi:hypothetical protein